MCAAIPLLGRQTQGDSWGLLASQPHLMVNPRSRWELLRNGDIQGWPLASTLTHTCACTPTHTGALVHTYKGCIIVHHVCILYFIYPFIHWWTLSLILHSGYFDWCGRGCHYVFENFVSISLAAYSEAKMPDHTVVLFELFWGTSVLFSIPIAPITFP